MDIDLSKLSESEYDSIFQVLQRDQKLRKFEERRIHQLRTEIQRLRKRGVLRPGLDSTRACSRCLAELGRIINRGALCPACKKRVCKSCRQYRDDGKQWLCVVCEKQRELKAISGEWMQGLSYNSSRRKGTRSSAPGDILWKTLQSRFRKSVAFSDKHVTNETEEQATTSTAPFTSVSSVPKKPPRTFDYKTNAFAPDKNSSTRNSSELGAIPKGEVPVAKCTDESRHFVYPPPTDMDRTVLKKVSRRRKSSSSSSVEEDHGGGQEDVPIRSNVPRTSPLSGKRGPQSSVIPVRGDTPPSPRESRLSADGSPIKHRSQSTSSEDQTVPVPTPRKRLSPLRKQQAVVEPLETSSVDAVDPVVPKQDSKFTLLGSTHDSGVTDLSCPVSPRTFSSDHSRQSSDLAGESSIDQGLPSPSASSLSESEIEKTTGVIFKKVNLKKKRSSEEVTEKYPNDESATVHRSSPRGRLRGRTRIPSGGNEDARQSTSGVPQISVSDYGESISGRGSVASSDKDSSVHLDEDVDQVFSYHCSSQASLTTFSGRSESMTSVYSAAGGGRYGTVTVTGDVLFSLSYNYKNGILETLVKECRNLAAVDSKRNRSDPYVKVYLLPDRTKGGKRKTKVKKHTLNPIFDEILRFPVTLSELETRTLWLSVWHSDMFGRNEFLGEVMIPLGHDVLENSNLIWHPLQERLEAPESPLSYKGDLVLSLKYVPPDVTATKKGKVSLGVAKGSLHILVKEARNLMATRSNGTSDPFCKSYLLPDKSKNSKQKTPVLKKTCNPKWNHTFVYDDVTLDDLKERCLELTVWDYDKITSNDFLGGVRLSAGTGKFQGRTVDWMDSQMEETCVWKAMLDRPNMWVDCSLLLRPSMQTRKS